MLSRFLFLLIISCSLSLAHSLKVFAKAGEGSLEIKGYYYGGSACKGCDVELRDENGAFASSKLDDEGKTSMELPNIANFKIAIIAGGGHMKESEFGNPNFAQNSQNTQENKGEQTALVSQNSQNSLNEQDESSSVFLELLKGFGAILVIFGIFGIIYFVKKKR